MREHGGVQVRDATERDLGAITAIYNELIPSRTVTWTERLDTVEERSVWFGHQQACGHPVIVAEDVDGEVVGFSTYGEFRDNAKWPGYRYTVELSIHVRDNRWGRGIGRALMAELVARAQQNGMHVIIAAVDGDNPESIAFHERMGFDVVGRLEQTGYKFDRWLDLVFMQRVLDGGGAA
jgi:phosphinothricin acetyltransferase